ncbi:hypothetical protein Landi51_03002 [Colletotrichum acutatum]
MHSFAGKESSAPDDDEDNDESAPNRDHIRGPKTKRQRISANRENIPTPSDTISTPSRVYEDPEDGSSREFAGDEVLRSTPHSLQVLQDTQLLSTGRPPTPASTSGASNRLSAHSSDETPRVPPEPHSDEVTASHTLTVDSTQLWRFPHTSKPTWVAREDQIHVPPKLLSLWPQVKTGLQVDLQCVVTQMVAEQAKEKDRAKRMDISRRTIFLELWMSGRQHNFWSTSVTISPCIWILCGSKSCRNKVRRVMRNLQLPELFMKHPVEIHEGAPKLSAINADVTLPQLLLDIERKFGLAHKNGTILYHIEALKSLQGAHSACGLLCCATFVKNGKIIDQHISRIGGLLTNGRDVTRRPIAITTSHGLLNYLWAGNDDHDATPESLIGSMELDQSTEDSGVLSANEPDSYSESESEPDDDISPSPYNHNSNETSPDDIKSEPVSPTTSPIFQNQDTKDYLGNRSVKDVTEWQCLEDIIGIRLCRERIPGFNKPPPPCSWTCRLCIAAIRLFIVLTERIVAGSRSGNIVLPYQRLA